MKKVGFTLPQEKNSIFSLPGRKNFFPRNQRKEISPQQIDKNTYFLAQTFARLA